MNIVKNIFKKELSIILILFISAIEILLNHILPAPLSLEAINLLNVINISYLLSVFLICINYLFKYTEEHLFENDPLTVGIYGESKFSSVALSYVVLININLLLVAILKYLNIIY